MNEYRYVEHLPDLICPEDYSTHLQGDLVRFRISVTNGEIELLGDAMRPEILEKLLEQLGPEIVEQMLCG